MPVGGRSGAAEHAAAPRPAAPWRFALLAAIVAGSLAALLALPPIAQNPAYHGFVDRRTLLGIPNFFDVVSNVAFLIVGVLGLRLCAGKPASGARTCWIVFFAGIALVSAGSAYYHWAPESGRLVWDRLPMTIAFMGLFVALLAEHIGPSASRLLLPAVLLGLASVAYWHYSGDLRPYVWVQLVPLLTIPVVIVMFPARGIGAWYLLAGLAFYVLAKIAEMYDPRIFALTGSAIGGHTLKHLLAALAGFAVYLMLLQRVRVPRPA